MADGEIGQRCGEAGAILILSLVFLIVVGGVVVVLANSVSSHLEDTGAFSQGRSLQYAATSAVDLAISNIRYTPLISAGETLEASPPVQCWNPDPGTAFSSSDGAAQWGGVNGEPLIDLWCSTVWNPTSASTRTVTISACEDAQNGSAQECAASPLLQAVVLFDDYPPGVSAPTTGICSVYCGSGETIESWSWSPTIPTVSDLRTADGTSGGPITGGTVITLAGTGFVAGATTVNFIQESGGTPSLVGATSPVTPVSGSVTSTSLQVAAPAVITGTTYFVTVTTPTGTSSACTSSQNNAPINPSNPSGGACFVFTYTTSNVVPVVSSLSVSHQSPPQGTNNGGDLITISGSNFYAGAQVNFIPEGSGSTQSATDIIVSSTGKQITAVTPPVIAGTYYLVQVVTAGGASSTSSTSTVQYTYDLPVPVVSGVGPNSANTSTSYVATAGSPLAVVGTSFFSGASVQFQPITGGSCSSYSYGTVSTSTLTVNSPSSITMTVPTGLSTNCSYTVAVANSTGTSSNSITFKL
jgi:hypothetical protein